MATITDLAPVFSKKSQNLGLIFSEKQFVFDVIFCNFAA
jgi:hypothetical protein